MVNVFALSTEPMKRDYKPALDLLSFILCFVISWYLVGALSHIFEWPKRVFVIQPDFSALSVDLENK